MTIPTPRITRIGDSTVAATEHHRQVIDQSIRSTTAGSISRRVTEGEVLEMYQNLTQPSVRQFELPLATICDLDGTVFTHVNDDGSLIRGHYDYGKCDLDLPVPRVINVVKFMAEMGHEILFVSGREDFARSLSVAAIDTHIGVKNYKLFMRKTGDHRKDFIIKREIYNGLIRDSYDVTLVLDDRNQVVDMWEELGLNVIQVVSREAGNF